MNININTNSDSSDDASIGRPSISIFWMRRDLRLHDNHGLYQALNSRYPVLVVFVFDKNILNTLSNPSDKRITFIHQSLVKVQEDLEHNKSSLWVIHDDPVQAFEMICTHFDVKEVFANHDYEPYARDRDAAIGAFLTAKNIAFHTYKDQVIFEKSEIIKHDGQPYSVFTPYSRSWKHALSGLPVQTYPSEKSLHNLLNIKPISIPTIQDLGFEPAESISITPTIKSDIIAHYDATRNFPAIEGTSSLSVHLRFGTVSIRNLVNVARTQNEHWLNALIWREFFMMILYHYPLVMTKCFKTKYENIMWRNNEDEFALWCQGKTGYAIVDAGMRELNETGLMHNRVRMIVASFLVKHLLVDWRWGEAYFAEKLLDYDLAANNGNWQWVAGCGCDAAPYFRVFNPDVQTLKFDRDHVYIKKWVPNDATDYLPPMVEHTFARARAIETYKRCVF